MHESQLSPAFKGTSIDNLYAPPLCTASPGEEAARKEKDQQQKIRNFVQTISTQEDVLELDRFVGLRSDDANPPLYYGDASAKLRVGMSLHTDGVIIQGSLVGTNGATEFINIYKMSHTGELFCADPDNQGPGEGIWMKMSLTAPRDAERVAEAKEMAHMIVENGAERAQLSYHRAKLIFSDATTRLYDNTPAGMRNSPADFSDLHDTVARALTLQTDISVNNPSAALQRYSERKTMEQTLKPYGIDFHNVDVLKNIVDSMKKAIDQHLKLDQERIDSQGKKDAIEPRMEAMQELHRLAFRL